MITVSSKNIKITSYKQKININIIDDYKIIINTEYNIKIDDCIAINNNYYCFNKIDNDTYTTDCKINMIDFFSKEAYQFWTIYDIENSCEILNDHIPKIYKLDKDLIIEGLFYLTNLDFYLERIYVNDGGVFKINKNIKNSDEKIIESELVKIVTKNSYGRDTYRSSKNDSLANKNSKLILNSVWWYQIPTKRSDFDLKYESIVNLYNFKLFGTKDAYHHLNSFSCILYNITILNSYSIELLQSPISMEKFKTVNCHYGISFYPPNIPFVTISECEIINSNTTIKRNSRSNLLLVDPIIDFENISFNGSVPISIHYSTKDKLIDEMGFPIPNSTVIYMYQKYNISNINKNVITITDESAPDDLYFISFLIDDNVYISDQSHGDLNGEKKIITKISNNKITLDLELENDFDTSTVYIRKYFEFVTDVDGSLPKINIPFSYYEKGSSIKKYYKSSVKIVQFNGTYQKYNINGVLGAEDLLQSGNNVLVSLEDKINSVLDQLLNNSDNGNSNNGNSDNDEFYINFSEKTL